MFFSLCRMSWLNYLLCYATNTIKHNMDKTLEHFILFHLLHRDDLDTSLDKLEPLECLLEDLELLQCFKYLFMLTFSKLDVPYCFSYLEINFVLMRHFQFSCCVIQVARAILENPKDKTKVHLIYANVTFEDILLKVISKCLYNINTMILI